MLIAPFLYSLTLFALHGCIVEDAPVNVSSGMQQSSSDGKAATSTKKVVGSAYTAPASIKVELSMFDSVQPNPVLAKLAKNKSKGASEKVCRWSKVNNKMKHFTVTIFPNPCPDIIQAAWHPVLEGTALVSLGKELWAVSGAEALPLPAVQGRPMDLGIDSDGVMLVRTIDANTNEEGDSIYRSYRYSDESWEIIDQQALEEGNTASRPAGWETIGPTTTDLHPGVDGIAFEIAPEELQTTLFSQLTRAVEDAQWVTASTKYGELAWLMQGPERNKPSLPIMLKTSEMWKPLQAIKYKVPENISIQFRDNYVLVTRMGTRPYIYDLATKQMPYKSVHTAGVLFWPEFKASKKETEPESVPKAIEN